MKKLKYCSEKKKQNISKYLLRTDNAVFHALFFLSRISQAWEDQEDKFHLEQAKLRSRIRIQDGRAKPIDLLAKYASSAVEGAEDLSGVEMHEPYTYLNGLTMRDLEDLLEDIKVYMELEQGPLCYTLFINFFNE